MNGKVYLDKIDKLITTNKYIPNLAEILDDEKTSMQYANYEQREYKDSDFDKFYVK